MPLYNSRVTHTPRSRMSESSVLTRTCTGCKIAKPATDEFFHAYKRAPDGRRSVCRLCRSLSYAATKDQTAVKRKAHYEANKERICSDARRYYHEHADEQRAAALKRHHANRDHRIVQQREYRAANAGALNERRRPKSRDAYRARYGIDLAFTFKHRLRSLLRVTLTKGRAGKRMAELLGYTAEDLAVHLERQFTKGMSWAKFMAGEIHIAHIIPVAAFGAMEVDSHAFRQCWALSNLRPAWAPDNLSKQDKVLTLL